MNLQKARPAFLGAAALYLFYLAYDLFQGRTAPETDMSLPVRYLFIALFALSAAGLLFYAYRLWAEARRQEREKREEPAEDEDEIKS